MINVYIVGSKGIPARYGGFETFVENLTKRKTSNEIHYFVSCMDGENDLFEYNGATCFVIRPKKDNAVGRIFHVSKALDWVENRVCKSQEKNEINIVYILGCRVGLLLKKHAKKLHDLGVIICSNPDGLEWKRDKWNNFEKKILLLSEKKLIKYSDQIICDSIGIKNYISSTYNFVNEKNTHFVAYGSDLKKSSSSDSELSAYLQKFNVSNHDYYLIIGRFVPENNYEIMIREFMKSNTKRKLLIISNVENNSFYKSLVSKLNFCSDPRIVFAGTLYDEELVKKVRENAFAYLHGHSVGGTNPSLLEAMASTKINILYDVIFNREVGGNQCLYFSAEEGNLSHLINTIENDNSLIVSLNPSEIIAKKYSWDLIINQYESLFTLIAKKENF